MMPVTVSAPPALGAAPNFIYFETSAWNRLTDRQDRAEIVDRIAMKGYRVVTSVYAAGEILSTAASVRRRLLGKTVASVCDREMPLLDHPEEFVTYVAEAWRNHESDFLAKESSGAKRLRYLIENPVQMDGCAQVEIIRWIREGAHADHQAVLDDLSSVGPRVGPSFCSPEILGMPNFNELLAEKVPVVSRLGLALEELLALCQFSDVWKAYRAMVAFVIDAGIDRMPEHRPNPSGGRPQNRPGGPDIRQAVYLGICETFVLRDDWLEESLAAIASAAGLERRIARTDAFFVEALSSE